MGDNGDKKMGYESTAASVDILNLLKIPCSFIHTIKYTTRSAVIAHDAGDVGAENHRLVSVEVHAWTPLYHTMLDCGSRKHLHQLPFLTWMLIQTSSNHVLFGRIEHNQWFVITGRWQCLMMMGIATTLFILVPDLCIMNNQSPMALCEGPASIFSRCLWSYKYSRPPSKYKQGCCRHFTSTRLFRPPHLKLITGTFKDSSWCDYDTMVVCPLSERSMQ